MDHQGDDFQSAREVCGGLSDTGAHTLETIAATKEFSSSPSTGKFDMPENVSKEFTGPPAQKRYDLCTIEPENVRNEQRIGFSFKVLSTLPPAPNKLLHGNVYFKVGLRAWATTLGARLYFTCQPSNAPADRPPARVVQTDFWYAPASRGKVSYKGNMELLNEASYKLAKQLSCSESAGLSHELDAS
ncbi:hypothetical protein [Streptomyces sp. L2]|uniref:hypothetical protein n=1 Tax=Streptomyces sp. L2 TaxID=2162665 RepID=UPI00101265F7|nr:hypothetical protein [Streptomyces sp. L2]